MKPLFDNSNDLSSLTQIDRRFFLKLTSLLSLTAFAPSVLALGNTSKIDLPQLIYSGGNWQPRPTALRRLAWETQKRTSAKMVLEPSSIKPFLSKLALNPLSYISGDRAFTPFDKKTLANLKRYLHLGGTVIIDPAYTPDGETDKFITIINTMIKTLFNNKEPVKITSDHVIFNSFYKLNRPEGMRKGSPWLTGYNIGDRTAVIMSDHDLGGAYAMDNLGNWKNDISPGGFRQRENAFRLGVNLIMYALCGDYKTETSHKHFLLSDKQGQ